MGAECGHGRCPGRGAPRQCRLASEQLQGQPYGRLPLRTGERLRRFERASDELRRDGRQRRWRRGDPGGATIGNLVRLLQEAPPLQKTNYRKQASVSSALLELKQVQQATGAMV